MTCGKCGGLCVVEDVEQIPFADLRESLAIFDGMTTGQRGHWDVVAAQAKVPRRQAFVQQWKCLICGWRGA